MYQHERTRGAICYPLDREKLAQALTNVLGFGTEPLESALVYGEGTKWAIVNTEGVGGFTDDYDSEARVYFTRRLEDENLISVYIESEKLPFNTIDELRTGESVDLADFIRVFGDRLDRNHQIWYDFAKEGELVH